MDTGTNNVSSSPEAEIAFRGRRPIKTSRMIDSPLLSPPGESLASMPSSDSNATPLSLDHETLRTGQDIAPYEAVICERLTDEIRALSSPKVERTEDHYAKPASRTLEEALRQTALTIRYNAKWFAENALSTLLETALTTASSSTSSNDLYAAVGLVDTVITYSLLPPKRLEQTVRFLSQTYYGATRAHKTKRLADAAWTTLRRILESHLSDQAVIALLDVVRGVDGAGAESRIGYAQVVGALMIISEKMLLKYDSHNSAPLPSLVQLLDSLWSAVINGNDNIREVVMELLPIVLTNERTAVTLDAELAWEALLDVVEPCITLTLGSPAVKPLLDTLLLRVDRFEPRKLSVLAHLAIDTDIDLPPELAESLVASYDDILVIRDTPDSFFKLLEKLSRSTHYTRELSMLVDKAVIEVFLRRPEHKVFLALVQSIQDLAVNQASMDEAADVLASALVVLFRRSARFAGRDFEKRTLFQALCKIASRCVPAAEALFSIRADVSGAVYVESGLLSHAFPAHSTASSVTAVMHDASSLSLQDWYRVILGVLEGQAGWRVCNYFLMEIPTLLGNHSMFADNIEFVRNVKSTVCQQLESGQYQEPPAVTGLTKSHVAMSLVQILTVALSYHRRLSKKETLQIVSTFVRVAGSRDYIVSTPCIHALTICCYEIPDLMASYMDDVIDKMSKMVTQKHLAVHVLYFLAGLSLHPALFHNFQTHDYKKIFGVCGSYLQSIRGTVFGTDKHLMAVSDQSSLTSSDSTEALPEHVYALAHHVIAFWYLALKPHDRPGLRDYITSCLRYKAADGRQVVEDQGIVTIDLMDRVDSKDINNPSNDSFDELDGRLTVTHRLSGLLLTTTETSLRNSKTILTVRRPTGTDRWAISGSCSGAEQRPDSVSITIESGEHDYLCVFPADDGGRTYGRVYIPPADAILGSEKVLTLPSDENITRALQSFDRTSALDCHKAGVIYIGEAQTTEDEILQNQMGTPEYVNFVLSLGDLVELKGATFNTQGLDRMSDADGQHAVIWHGQVTEVVFHVTTLMPNCDDVALNTASKKRHIGNDYVNIVFNNSGTPFDFHTFPSQFNLVYIVITPSARTSFIQSRTEGTTKDRKDQFYTVQVQARSGYPAISSATEPKIISGESLAGYVRNLALNECIFSLMWAYKDEPGEYPSSWRSRLLQIRRFRERYSS